MFDLEQAITEWRKQMVAAGVKSPEPLGELEGHLREEIEQQVRTGLSVQQAFAVATRQMGQADSLNNEFQKAAKEARDWKLNQIISACCLCLVTSVIATALCRNGNITSAQRMSGLAALAVFNLLTVAGRLGYHLFPVIPNQRIRNTIFVSVGALLALWWTVFFNVILLRADCTVGQLIVAVLWGMIMPGGILCGLIAGIETAVWKKSATGW